MSYFFGISQSVLEKFSMLLFYNVMSVHGIFYFYICLKCIDYFWLFWVFVAAPGLSLVAVRGASLIVVASLGVEHGWEGFSS